MLDNKMEVRLRPLVAQKKSQKPSKSHSLWFVDRESDRNCKNRTRNGPKAIVFGHRTGEKMNQERTLAFGLEQKNQTRNRGKATTFGPETRETYY